MGFTESLRLRGLAMQEAAYKCIGIGFLVYLAATFILDSGQQRSFFFLFIALPALFLLVRSWQLFRTDAFPLVSILLCLGYFSLSAAWGGEESVAHMLKLSLYLYCLMLGIEAACKRFSSAYLAGFIALVGGLAMCASMLAVLYSGADLSSLLTQRHSFATLSGWGSDNPINSAIVMGLVVLAAWWVFPGKKWYLQILLLAVIVISLMLMVFTKSRGPMLALGVGLALMTVFRRDCADLLLALLIAASAAVLVVSTDILSLFAQRLTEPNYRMEIWLQVWERFQDNWLFGQGLGHDARISLLSGTVFVTHSHSSVFEMFRVGGVIGGGLFLLMVGFLVGRSITKPAGFFLLWLIFGLICLSSNGRALLSRPSIEWFAFWMPILLLYFSTRADAASQQSEHSA
jgi:O-antigen ligase